jgi:hypothetical protein
MTPSVDFIIGFAPLILRSRYSIKQERVELARLRQEH